MLNRGFTLLEVLITLIILMFGLLGLAGLMAKGQRASYEAYQRQQALTLATDIAERLRTNAVSAAAYAAAAPLPTPLGAGARFANIGITIANCAGTTCTAAQIADYDTALWDGALSGATKVEIGTATSIGGIVGARGCIVDTGQAMVGTGMTGRIYRVAVAWQGRDATTASAASTCGTGQFGNENLRRVVTLDVMAVN
jgi:type IV pilus assembly protein PilV